MSALETLRSDAKVLRAGKYMFADSGEKRLANATKKTMYHFWCLVNIEYGGVVGNLPGSFGVDDLLLFSRSLLIPFCPILHGDVSSILLEQTELSRKFHEFP